MIVSFLNGINQLVSVPESEYIFSEVRGLIFLKVIEMFLLTTLEFIIEHEGCYERITTASRFNYTIIINSIISFVSSDGRKTVSFELGSVKKEAVWPNLILY
jgi:hypothetical protein